MGTCPAISEGGEHDVVAWGDVMYPGPGLFDDTRAFVPEYDRRFERNRAVHNAEVAVTDSRVDDPNGEFTRARLAYLEPVAHSQLVSVKDDPPHADSPFTRFP
jgi:hypothetical protein